jgi:hypothetical protein
VTNEDRFSGTPRTILTSAMALSQISPLNFVESSTSTFASFSNPGKRLIIIGQNRNIGSNLVGNSNFTANISTFFITL